jgi:hypothetical protein
LSFHSSRPRSDQSKSAAIKKRREPPDRSTALAAGRRNLGRYNCAAKSQFREGEEPSAEHFLGGGAEPAMCQPRFESAGCGQRIERARIRNSFDC